MDHLLHPLQFPSASPASPEAFNDGLAKEIWVSPESQDLIHLHSAMHRGVTIEDITDASLQSWDNLRDLLFTDPVRGELYIQNLKEARYELASRNSVLIDQSTLSDVESESCTFSTREAIAAFLALVESRNLPSRFTLR